MLASKLADAILRSSARLKAALLGWTYAIVTDNQDPEGLGRVRVRMPWHRPGVSSDWVPKHAGINIPYAGETYAIPQPGEVVRVSFMGGDVAMPAYEVVSVPPKAAGRGIGDELLGDDDPEVVRRGYENWKDGYPPIAQTREEAEADGKAYISAEDRIDVARGRDLGRGTWRTWYDAAMTRLRAWLADKDLETWQIDVRHDSDGGRHHLEAKSPRGITGRVEDRSNGRVLRLQTPSGLLLEAQEDSAGRVVQLRTPNGTGIVIDERGGVRVILDDPTNGGRITMDSSGITVETNAQVSVRAPLVLLADGGELKPVARVGDLVQVAGMVGTIITGSSKVMSG